MAYLGIWTARRRWMAVAVVGALVSLATPATAQNEQPSDAELAGIGTTAEALAAIEPNAAWNGLGFFSDDALRVLEVVSEPVSASPYAFGDDLDTPPVITPDGTNVVEFGVVHTRVPDGWNPPTGGVSGQVAYAETTPLAAGDDLTLVWTEFDSSFDFSSGLTLNEGVTLAIPGLPVWNSSFEGDTWEGANLIPTAQLVDGILTFVVNRYQPPQSFDPVAIPAFYYRSGNIMAVGISSDAIGELVAEGGGIDQDAAAVDGGVNSTLLFTGSMSQQTVQSGTLPNWTDRVAIGVHQHTASALFAAGFVLRFLPVVPTLIPFVLIALMTLSAPQIPAETEAPDEPETPAEPAPPTEEDQPAIDPPAVNPEPSPSPSSDGGGLPLLAIFALVIMIGLGLIFFGTRLVGGTKEREPKGGGGTKTDDDDDEDEDEDDEDPRDAPPPTLYGEEPEESCFWSAVYFAQTDHVGERASGAPLGATRVLHMSRDVESGDVEKCAEYQISVVTEGLETKVTESGAKGRRWSRRIRDSAIPGDEMFKRAATGIVELFGGGKTADLGAVWTQHDQKVRGSSWASGFFAASRAAIEDDDGYRPPRGIDERVEGAFAGTAERWSGREIDDLGAKEKKQGTRNAVEKFHASARRKEVTRIFIELVGESGCAPGDGHTWTLDAKSSVGGEAKMSCAQHGAMCAQDLQLQAGTAAKVASNLTWCDYAVVKPDYNKVGAKGSAGTVTATFAGPELTFSAGIEKEVKIAGRTVGKAGLSLGGVSIKPTLADEHNKSVPLPLLSEGASGKDTGSRLEVQAFSDTWADSKVKTNTMEMAQVGVDVDADVWAFASHSFRITGHTNRPKCSCCDPSIEIVLGHAFNPEKGGFDDDKVDGYIRVGGKTWYLKRPSAWRELRGKRVGNWEIVGES